MMARSSLKKMSGSKRRKEGNYASSDKSSSVRAFKSDDLGLTLSPGPQIQKEDEANTSTASSCNSRPCRSDYQRPKESYLSEPKKQCRTAAIRSMVDKIAENSSYSEYSVSPQSYLRGRDQSEGAVCVSQESRSGNLGEDDIKGDHLTLPTNTFLNDTLNNLHHVVKGHVPRFQYGDHHDLPKKKRKFQGGRSGQSPHQITPKKESRSSYNAESGSFETIAGDKVVCPSDVGERSLENLPIFTLHGAKLRLSELPVQASSSGNLSRFTSSKSILEQGASKVFPLTLAHRSSQKPLQSILASDRREINSDSSETNGRLHSPSIELQRSAKATPTVYRRLTLNSDFSPRQIHRSQSVSHLVQKDIRRKLLRSGKILKRSWTRHFPTSLQDPQWKGRASRHANTSLIARSCSIASGRTRVFENIRASSSRQDSVEHVNLNILPNPLPPFFRPSTPSFRPSKRRYSDNFSHTNFIEPQVKSCIRRTHSLPDLRSLHHSSDMHPPQNSNQIPSPPEEHRPLRFNGPASSPQAWQYSAFSMNHASHLMGGSIPRNTNSSPTAMSSQAVPAYIGQSNRHFANTNSDGFTNVHPQFQGIVQDLYHQPSNIQPAFTNGHRANFNVQHQRQRYYSYDEVRNLQRNLEQRNIHLQTQIERLYKENAKKDAELQLAKRERNPAKVIGNIMRAHPPTPQTGTIINDNSSPERITIDLTDDDESSASGSVASAHAINTSLQSQHAFPQSSPASQESAQSLSIHEPPTESAEHLQAHHAPLEHALGILPNHTHFNQYPTNQYQPAYSTQGELAQNQQLHRPSPIGHYQAAPYPPNSNLAAPSVQFPGSPVQINALAAGQLQEGQAEPAGAQREAGQQQSASTPIEGLQGQVAADDKAYEKAVKAIRDKPLEWYQGLHPFRDHSKTNNQFGPACSTATTQPTVPAYSRSRAPIEDMPPPNPITSGKLSRVSLNKPKKTLKEKSNKPSTKTPKKTLTEAEKLEQKAKQAESRKRHAEKKKAQKLRQKQSAETPNASRNITPQLSLDGSPLPQYQSQPGKSGANTVPDNHASISGSHDANGGPDSAAEGELTAAELEAEMLEWTEQQEKKKETPQDGAAAASDAAAEISELFEDVDSDRESQWSEAS